MLYPKKIGRTTKAIESSYELSQKRKIIIFFYIDEITQDIIDSAKSIGKIRMYQEYETITQIQINNFNIIKFNPDTFDFNLFIERGRQLPRKKDVILDHKLVEDYINRVYNAINETVSEVHWLKKDFIVFSQVLNNILLSDHIYDQDSFEVLIDIINKMKQKLNEV